MIHRLFRLCITMPIPICKICNTIITDKKDGIVPCIGNQCIDDKICKMCLENNYCFGCKTYICPTCQPINECPTCHKRCCKECVRFCDNKNCEHLFCGDYNCTQSVFYHKIVCYICDDLKCRYLTRECCFCTSLICDSCCRNPTDLNPYCRNCV